MSAHTPVVSVVEDNGMWVEFRIEGGEIDPKWTSRGTPWCRFSVWHSSLASGSNFLSSYGGEVWPMAYPALFRGPELSPGAINRNPSHTFLTDAGRAAVDAAIAAAKGTR